MSVPPAVAGEQHAPADSFVLFQLGGRNCGVAAAAVVEIVAAVATSPLPGQPAFIAGVIDLRGTALPVLDLRVRFGGDPRPMELSDRLIVVRARGRLLALWVDEVEAFASGEALAWSTSGGLVVGDRSLAGVAATANGVATIHDVDAFVEQCEADAVYEAVGI